MNIKIAIYRAIMVLVLAAVLPSCTDKRLERKLVQKLINAVLKLANDKEPDNSIWHPMK